MIDMDPQGNATSGLGLPKSKIKKTIYDVIIGRCDIKETIIKTKFKNLSVIPANIDLAGAELELYEYAFSLGKYKDVDKKYAGKELPGWRMKKE